MKTKCELCGAEVLRALTAEGKVVLVEPHSVPFATLRDAGDGLRAIIHAGHLPHVCAEVKS